MHEVPPPGRLALSLGANAVATCVCGSNAFFPLVKLTPEHKDDTLVCLKCVVCLEETVVPIDPKREGIIKPWDDQLKPENMQ